MRRHCRRRKADPLAHPALLASCPVPDGDLLGVRVREHLALGALVARQGCRVDLRDLLTSAAVARELASMGYGPDELSDLARVDKVLASVKASPGAAFGIGGPDLPAVRWLLLYHDAQRVAASARDYIKALASVRAEPSRYGIWQA